MKTIGRLAASALLIMLLLMLAACTSGADRYELTNYIGKSVSAFEKRSGIRLEEQGNGVYLEKDVVQVLVKDKKVSSLTLLAGAGEYTLYGLVIGMTKESADSLLKESFGKEVSKTSDPGNNSVTYTYRKDDKQVCIIYDKDKKTLIGASYYTVIESDSKEEVTAPPGDSGEMMISIGDQEVYYNEAMAYLKLAQNQYEADYGSGIWKVDILENGETFGEMIKKEVINQIIELKIIHAEAEQQNMSLTEEEQAEANSYAKEQYSSLSDKEKKQNHITEELLQQVYYDNMLADKMFENLTINVNTDVPDKEAKQITVQDIYIQNYNLDSEGKKVPLSEEDKKAAYQKVQSLLEQAKGTDDFKTLAEANTEDEDTEFTFGKGKGPKRFGDAFEKAAFSLKTGKISDIVTTDSGWHIIYCVTDFNEDATTQVKESIIEQRRNDMFGKLYAKWSADYEIIVNQEAWDEVSLETE